MSARPRILLDPTSLRGSSILHGIGRYIYDLLVGLSETRDEWSSEVAIEAILELRWGRAAVSEDLAALADGAREGKRDTDATLLSRRFLTLGPTALERRADVVHVLQARGLPLLLPTRSVVTCYDLIPLHYPKEYLHTKTAHAWRYVRDWHRYRMPTRVAAISERTAQELSRVRVPKDRIDVIPTGIDLSAWSSAVNGESETKPREANEGRPFVLYVGNCDHRKNAEGMFASLARARREVDVRMLWAGHMAPPRFARATALAKEHGVTDAVTFLGFVPDAELATLYRRARALLFLSRLEGFGLPVAEAMAAGCPSIVSRASASDEVAGDAGIVIDADDPTAGADAIVRLTRDDALRAKLADNGRARVGRFDRREMARGYVESYRRAARG